VPDYFLAKVLSKMFVVVVGLGSRKRSARAGSSPNASSSAAEPQCSARAGTSAQVRRCKLVCPRRTGHQNINVGFFFSKKLFAKRLKRLRGGGRDVSTRGRNVVVVVVVEAVRPGHAALRRRSVQVRAQAGRSHVRARRTQGSRGVRG
jgi:hypothetical protein